MEPRIHSYTISSCNFRYCHPILKYLVRQSSGSLDSQVQNDIKCDVVNIMADLILQDDQQEIEMNGNDDSSACVKTFIKGSLWHEVSFSNKGVLYGYFGVC